MGELAFTKFGFNLICKIFWQHRPEGCFEIFTYFVNGWQSGKV